MVSNELRRFDRFNRKHILYRLSPRPPRIISYRDEVRRRVTDQVNAIIIIDPRIFPRTHAHASGCVGSFIYEMHAPPKRHVSQRACSYVSMEIWRVASRRVLIRK